MILGMMLNKNHNEYLSYFKGKINSLTIVDIPNQENAIGREELINKLKLEGLKINSKPTIQEAISSIPLKDNEIVLVTGSLYLAGEVLNLN